MNIIVVSTLSTIYKPAAVVTEFGRLVDKHSTNRYWGIGFFDSSRRGITLTDQCM
jgi:hypothetical protein